MNFRDENLAADGFERTSPVTAFPANGYGLHDMIGNVWECPMRPKACCIPENPRGGAEAGSYDPALPNVRDSTQGS